MTDISPDRTPDAWSAGAEGYEAAFAPFTGPFSDEALRLTGVGPGTRVLDVAAGSGALSRRAARLGADVLATDFASGMVDLLRARFADEGLDGARAEVMDGQALTLDDDTFDAAFSMFGVIFFPDRDAGLRELARVVRPSGSVCVATWRIEGFRMLDLIGSSLARAVPGFDAPADPPPWAELGDADGLADALRRAGLDDVDVHTVTRPFAPVDPGDFFRALPDWAPTATPLFEALPAEAIDAGAEAFAELIAELIAEQDDGGLGVPMDALLGIGRPT
jgi:SAM-dependent methyltransferase